MKITEKATSNDFIVLSEYFLPNIHNLRRFKIEIFSALELNLFLFYKEESNVSLLDQI